MRYQHIIFDFDGTIADTLDLVLEFSAEYQREHPRLRTIDKESFRNMSMREALSFVGLSFTPSEPNSPPATPSIPFRTSKKGKKTALARVAKRVFFPFSEEFRQALLRFTSNRLRGRSLAQG